jgi:hypothetical protein
MVQRPTESGRYALKERSKSAIARVSLRTTQRTAPSAALKRARSLRAQGDTRHVMP